MEVLEQDPKRSRVYYPDYQDEFDAFSVHTDELKPHSNENLTPSERPKVVSGEPMKTDAVPADWGTFASYCERMGYKMYVTWRKEGEIEAAEEEYFEWTGGEILPDECIKPQTQYYGSTFNREWHAGDGLHRQDAVPSGP